MGSKRNGGIELLRVWAALGIVCFHSQTGVLALVGYAGLPAFAIISAYLLGDLHSADGMKAVPFEQFVRRRARRVLLPWVAWIAIYLSLDFGLSFAGLRPFDFWQEFNPFFGTRIHLWYLPFVFLGLVAIRAAVPWLSRLPRWPLVGMLVLAAALAMLVLPGTWVAQLPAPAPQFVFAAPALCFGIALAEIVQESDTRRRWSAVAAICVVAVGGAILKQSLFGFSWIPFAVAVPLTSIAVLRPVDEGPLARLVAPLTLGIYVMHPLVVSLLDKSHALVRLGIPQELTFVVAFLLCAVTVYVMRRTPIRQVV
jgi:peptidoglycan/LPS O-acetylase OafA/YrhL